MPKRNLYERGPEAPDSKADEIMDWSAEEAFRSRTEKKEGEKGLEKGLAEIIAESRGSARLAEAVKEFLLRRGFKAADPANLVMGFVVEPYSNNQGVIISVYGRGRRIDVDPDTWEEEESPSS